MTLVEVVVGIALLAVLLVLILSSFRAHAAQVRAANLRMQAIRRADELLSTWTASGGIPAVGESEQVPNSPEWTWRIVRAAQSPELTQLGAESVRLEIVATPFAVEDLPLTSVELVVPAEGAAAR